MKQSLNFQFDLHTVIVLCGPTQCGKTTFAEKLTKALTPLGEVAYLSSDAIRQQLLGPNAPDHVLDKHGPQMLSVSRQAFELLFARLRAHTTYPVNTPFVIIDTRGMDQGFRKQVLEAAKVNNYKAALITFEYKDRAEYTQYGTDEQKRIADFDLSKFLRRTMTEIASDHDRYAKSGKWDQRLRVKVRDSDVNVSLKAPSAAFGGPTEAAYPAGGAVAVIGDVHESVEAFSELLDNLRAKYGQDLEVVQLGDYLDKGHATIRMIHKMYHEYSKNGLLLVRGNHENYVYRALKGEVDRDPELEKSYFTSILALEGDDPEVVAARDMFFKMYEDSSPFLRLCSPGARDVIVTHAPCEVKYLGKMDFESQRAQRNFYFKDRTTPVREVLEFLHKESDSAHPFHVFGHIAHDSKTLLYKNKVYLDTAAVYGGKLTAFVMKNGQYHIEQVSSPNLTGDIKELPDDLTTDLRAFKPFDIRDYDLTPQEMRLVRHVKHQGTKFISGTMPPAPSTATELEPLESALEYFRKRGVEKVVLQPKYMGSRCQLYLYRDVEKAPFAVSRGGWKIRKVTTPVLLDGKVTSQPVAYADSDLELTDLLSHWTAKAFQDAEFNSIILDGELLPWKALGAGLIDHTFVPYGHLVGYEMSVLSEDFAFRNMDLGKTLDPMQKMSHLAEYEETLAQYAGDAPLEFRPFNILEVDGQPYQGDNWTAFKTFNDDPILVVDLSKPETYEAELSQAKGFYETLTVGKRMEGVVVKPLDPAVSLYEGKDKVDVVPYMKVRNPDYMRLIYGYDYMDRLDKLIRQKNISGKAAVGLREHRLAHKMLTADDEKRQEYVVKMIGEMKREATLDPRL